MDKIDLIIATLQRVECLFEAHGQYPHTLREVNEALAAARELKVLKPIGMASKHIYRGAALFDDVVLPEETLLYALDEVTK
jgi:hypothetical protein